MPVADMSSLGKTSEVAFSLKESLLHFVMMAGVTTAMAMTPSYGQANNRGQMAQWECLMALIQLEHSTCLRQLDLLSSKLFLRVRGCQISIVILCFEVEPTSYDSTGNGRLKMN